MTEEERRIPCPHCAEKILPTARVCRFCGREVGTVEALPPNAASKDAKPKTGTKNSSGAGAAIAVFFLVVVGFPIYMVVRSFSSDADEVRPRLEEDFTATWGGNVLALTAKAQNHGDCAIEINDEFSVPGKQVYAGQTLYVDLGEFSKKGGLRFDWRRYKVNTVAIACKKPWLHTAGFRSRK
jgi:DNA-directed RNA polymerase subunit RPC12/RpoP